MPSQLGQPPEGGTPIVMHEPASGTTHAVPEELLELELVEEDELEELLLELELLEDVPPDDTLLDELPLDEDDDPPALDELPLEPPSPCKPLSWAMT